jgi:predicted amidohydrolase
VATLYRIALANLRFPGSPEESIELARNAVVDASAAGARIVCFPECFIPGYRSAGRSLPPPTYTPGAERRMFGNDAFRFGVVICHEGWRYPETVRWAARCGAQVVFHPHFHEAEGDSYQPMSFGDPLNTFHEKALLCRAAENTCYVATANCASVGSPSTSAIIDPDGTLLAYQPYGKEGLLIADIDLSKATGLLAKRYKPIAVRSPE